VSTVKQISKNILIIILWCLVVAENVKTVVADILEVCDNLRCFSLILII